MKKVRGENSEKDIDSALQRLDRLNLDEGLATGVQTLQAVNKAERVYFLRNVAIDDRGTELDFDFQVTTCDRKSGNGFHLQIPGRTTTSFVILGIAEQEHG